MKIFLISVLLSFSSCSTGSMLKFNSDPPSNPQESDISPVKEHKEYPLAASPHYAAWKVWIVIIGLILIICAVSSYGSIYNLVKSKKTKSKKRPENISLGSLSGKK